MPAAPPLDVLGSAAARLRPIEEGDLGALLAMLQQPSVHRWWGDYDLARVRRELLEDADVVVWTITDAHGTVLGLVQAYEEGDPNYRHAGIDISLCEAAQDRGLGTDVVRTVARWLIVARGHHRLVIDPAAENARAIASYAKVGFRPVGVLRHHELAPDGTWRDGLLMDLLADELT